RSSQDVLKIIENKSKVRNSRNKPIVSQVKTSNVDSSDIASAVASAVTSAMTGMFKKYQVTPDPASVKAIEESCVTCGGAHSYRQCPATDGKKNSDGPSVPMPPPFINPEEDERAEETLTDPKLAEYTIKYHKMLKALLSNKEKLLELANTTLNENCSAVILKKLHKKLGDPGKYLILYGFSELKCKALADLGASINLMPLLISKKLGLPKLISTRMTLELVNRSVCTPAGIARNVFVPVGRFTFPTYFVIVDYESDPRVPLILGRRFLRTARALIDVYGEELILRDGDERLILNMKHDTSSYSNKPQRESINMIDIYNISYEDYLEDLNDDMTPEDGIREIEYLLNRDPLAEYSPNNDLLYTIPEKFTDEHTLDYSSPPRYDDLFDSKEDKIKDFKLLINELDSPGSSSFLPHFLESDSVLYEGFYEVDTFTSR
nr:reverse transcriptase domain-containing protein [Tanacetum cinerariifolium]